MPSSIIKRKSIDNKFNTYIASSNRVRYSQFRNKIKDFHKSEQWAIRQCVSDNCSILDIGCASGGVPTGDPLLKDAFSPKIELIIDQHKIKYF